MRVTAGEFKKIYDPSVGEKEAWYINDHCFVFGPDRRWHMFGITHAEPLNPLDEKEFAHAISDRLTATPWRKEPFAMSAEWDPWRESHLWAPHVIRHNGFYYMFYCAGDPDHTKYKLHLATSKDMKTWTRHPKNPMVVDGFDARDPMIVKIGREWVMYYTANEKPEGGRHLVAYRKSKNLIDWGERRVAFTDTESGTFGGPTESPFVVRRGKYWYLFIGPRGGYDGTDVFRSEDPFHWEASQQVGHFPAHAAEVVRDTDGKWYLSRAGWGKGGLYLAPLEWNDGQRESDTSMPKPR
jgi:predicted GH43/DUF377 family glycosyl hydrolase